jgi:hypothetical protein
VSSRFPNMAIGVILGDLLSLWRDSAVVPVTARVIAPSGDMMATQRAARRPASAYALAGFRLFKRGRRTAVLAVTATTSLTDSAKGKRK